MRHSMWCCTKVILIRNSIFSGTEHFFPGTQAFTNPPDMASSGVFCHTPDEAMSGGLAKACVLGKNCSVPEKIEFLIEYQTE